MHIYEMQYTVYLSFSLIPSTWGIHFNYEHYPCYEIYSWLITAVYLLLCFNLWQQKICKKTLTLFSVSSVFLWVHICCPVNYFTLFLYYLFAEVQTYASRTLLRCSHETAFLSYTVFNYNILHTLRCIRLY